MRRLSLLVLVCLAVLALATLSSASPAQRGYAEESDWGAGAVRSKKPFCNAFTGCGRKRADPDMETEELMQLLAARVQGIRDQVSRHNVKVEEL